MPVLEITVEAKVKESHVDAFLERYNFEKVSVERKNNRLFGTVTEMEVK